MDFSPIQMASVVLIFASVNSIIPIFDFHFHYLDNSSSDKPLGSGSV